MIEVATKELPEGWVISPLSVCAEILDSKRIPINSKERSARIDGKSQDELYPYYGATGQVGVIDGYIFEGEYLLIGEDGAPFFDKSKNVAYIAKGKFWVNNHAHILDAIEGVTSNKYLLHYLNKFNYKDYVGGTTRLKLNQADLKQIPVPLAPPEQQKRIVVKIEELFSHIDAGIEALKKTKQLLKQYRQSVLKAAVTGELTKEWREANKDKLEPASQLLERILKERREKWEEQQIEQFKAKGKMPKDGKWKEKYKEPVATRDWEFLSDIPDTWSWVSVDQIGDSQDQPVLTGPFGSNLGKRDFTQDGVPVLTIGCLQEEGIDLSRAMHVSKEKAEELDRYQLKEGDMLFSRMAAVGRAGFVTPELEGALFNYHIMRLRLHTHAMLQEYFVHYVRGSSQVYDYVKEVNHGATRDGINTQQLLELPVALAPLQEQKEVCKVVGEKLGAIRRLESDINIQLMKAERNKQSVLVSAFTGLLLVESSLVSSAVSTAHG